MPRTLEQPIFVKMPGRRQRFVERTVTLVWKDRRILISGTKGINLASGLGLAKTRTYNKKKPYVKYVQGVYENGATPAKKTAHAVRDHDGKS